MMKFYNVTNTYFLDLILLNQLADYQRFVKSTGTSGIHF